MPFSKKPAAGEAGDGSGGKKSGSDLLIRFFESPWFDAYIALTYLYKSNSPGVQDYLCNRLYTLPERDVERYLSQLTQLCIQRPSSSLERVLLDLCGQSLRIAVKTYWLLLAISQDQPKDGHVAALRDGCEQAALQGQWQLPFKHWRLPPPLSASPAKRASGRVSGGATPALVSPSASFTHLPRPGWATSPEPRRFGAADSLPMSPGDSRPMSPDGLGGGLYSSVFMDTGVEGLLYSDPSMDDELRETRQHVSSPHARHGALLEGPGRPLLPIRLPEPPLAGGLPPDLLLRGASAWEGSPRAVVYAAEEALAAGAGGRAGSRGGAAGLLSPPNSPRRRQTTFGATLDFVETLCQASSSLTAFQPEDRQWALRRALQQINAEIEKASRDGVTIWFPMGEADLRVVRLAPRESRLLNSREKAPFTLCVEVLDEAEAAAAVDARAAAAAAAAAAAVEAAAAAAGKPPLARGGGSGQYADSAKSVLLGDQPPPADDDGAAAAAAEAARSGIPFIANHHRTQSLDTASISSGGTDAAALAAVQGSSAVSGDAAGAAAPTPRSAAGSPLGSARSVGSLGGEPSFAAMLGSGGSPFRGAGGGGASPAAAAGSPARPRRLTDDLDAVSDVPSISEEGSSMLGSPAAPPASAADAAANGCSVVFDSASLRPQQTAQPPAGHAQPPSLALPGCPAGKQPGAGTWIGGGAGGSPALSRGGSMALQERVSSSLETALASLRGEAPLVTVRLEVLNDTPLSPARGSGGGGTERPPLPPAAPAAEGASPLAAAAAAGAERRRASLEAAARAQHQCDRSSWACKLGLCKLCNAGLATMGGDDELSLPRVRLHLVVQGGVDLTIKRTPSKHQRMPSHEAILKVAKQHKLPAPQLPDVLAPPRHQAVGASPGAPPPLQPPSRQRHGGTGRTAACLPVWRPAGGDGGGGAAEEMSAEEALRKEAAEAAYGERWSARKARVQAASPHGRRPGWDLRCVIVKTGDDCRQELLAMQLIRAFSEIFAEAQLPLWLRTYQVLPTSNRTALIEMVPNAPSIHALKSKHPPGMSLRDHLAAKFGGAGSPAFKRAQRCFVESLAAYSLVCYLLQIKDRHNGNILLDDEGHLIHIDFGFMLSNSPGGVNFESAPFKLTRELLEVMDSDSEGRASEPFDYFKVLMIQGFLAVRKHADRILLLVEMMQGSGCPCFKSRVAAVQGLRKRFQLAAPEPQLVESVLGLISDSLDAWRTRQYDYYQRVLNGIL